MEREGRAQDPVEEGPLGGGVPPLPGAAQTLEIIEGEIDVIKFTLKVPYYTVFHQYIIGLRYIQNMPLKCLAPNTKQIIAASHNPLCFSPVSKVLILCLLL